MTILSKGIDRIKEVVLSLLVAIDDGLPWVGRELSIFDDELMQVVSEEVGTGVSTVAVENSEETALRPLLYVLLVRRLHDVEHDTDSVLVVVSDDALVRVGCVAHYEAILTNRALGGLPTRQVESSRIGRSTVPQKELLYLLRIA